MHDALQHFVLLLFAAGFCGVGWFMAHDPARTYRFFTLGTQPENRFLVGFCKICGWCFTVAFAGGTVLQLGLMIRDLLR